MSFDSPPENCLFLGGDKPGEYYCRFVTEGIIPDAKTMVAIGEGCCSPLNSDRKLATPIPPNTKELGILGGIL